MRASTCEEFVYGITEQQLWSESWSSHWHNRIPNKAAEVVIKLDM